MHMLHTFCKMKVKMLFQLKLRKVPVVVKSRPTHIRIQLLSIVQQQQQVPDWTVHHQECSQLS